MSNSDKQIENSTITKKLTVTKKYSDIEMKKIKGSFHNDWSYLINYDCDVYDTKNALLLKFRKNVIPKDLCNLAMEAYEETGFLRSNNRGDASGRRDDSGNLLHRKFKP